MTGTPTRRRLLHAVGVAATATLAGCSSSGDDETSSAETTGGTRTTGTAVGSTSTGTGTAEMTASGTTDATETTTDETTEETTTNGTTTETPPPEGGGDVRFTTRNGATVRGTLLGDGECALVFAHDAGFDRKSWLPMAKRFAENGNTCLTIDVKLGSDAAPEYVLAAIRYLRERVGVERVLLVGAGAGANAVIRANARAESGTVDGTFALSPEEGEDVVAEMQGWKLFVVSQGDDEEYVQMAKRMEAAAANPARLEQVSGSEHGQAVVESNPEETWSIMNSLLRTVCG
ncbi:alpha/beta hydrolase family protein [Haladaptatus sp. CMAA 1911]|uniref:alpha/beta hydrolase family protein n=1 Tax=unclassified Haladaptatus TaxID=2622732 RepID=UPI00375469D1